MIRRDGFKIEHRASRSKSAMRKIYLMHPVNQKLVVDCGGSHRAGHAHHQNERHQSEPIAKWHIIHHVLRFGKHPRILEGPVCLDQIAWFWPNRMYSFNTKTDDCSCTNADSGPRSKHIDRCIDGEGTLKLGNFTCTNYA